MNVTKDLRLQIGFQQEKVQTISTINLITNGPKLIKRIKIGIHVTLSLNNVVTLYGDIRKEKNVKH